MRQVTNDDQGRGEESAIGDQLAKALLAGEVREGDTVQVDLDESADGGTGALVVSRAS